MKILIINNHTKHLLELESLLKRYGEISVVDNMDRIPSDEYDLVAVSGGSECKTVVNHPELYQRYFEFLRSTSSKVIGICLGAEIIACCFGSKLVKSEYPINKIVTLKSGEEVIERHCRKIVELGESLEGVKESQLGREIIKHKHKPIVGLQFHPEINPWEQDGDELLDQIISQL